VVVKRPGPPCGRVVGLIIKSLLLALGRDVGMGVVAIRGEADAREWVGGRNGERFGLGFGMVVSWLSA